LLRLIMNMDPHVAVGTTMALIIPTALSAALNYWRKKEIDMDMGRVMVLPAVLGVCVGAYATKFVQGHTLMLSFAAFVCVAGLDLSFGIVQTMFRRSAQTDDTVSVEPAAPPSADKNYVLKLVIVGLSAGYMAGFFGVGGGFIFVPCLMYLFKTP